ncbi:hypothetical protein LRI_1096 [Limosilactobacillus reuteri I5007]|uniref:Uncharacterized protein n=4 Tax=Limosilactobacillus reuteri TaxID=1598 RepID=A0A0U5JPQ6_LIMRT|nr:hypothetical protein LRI_1096 [Limosilactobacillus reuteri I5007]AGR65129.1 hypothetical protein N134_04760 [Limosilactobacillus reuteri TD1]AWD62300.1 hypothetical protein LWHH1689_0982 [Limosilactobacillus reuteri]CCC02906.1 hypothetical protein LRATCC53608_0157 [Limosilactobacillus reuteri subsp. suis]CUR38507.1 hypothetical protein LRLP16767_LR3C6_00465 [Limosilactobacillus reuteri subsp. porcinus]
MKCPCHNLSKNQKIVLLTLVAGALIWPMYLLYKLAKKN